MSIGWMIDDLIDSGHYDGMNTGCDFRPSYKRSTVPFSKRASELYSQLQADDVEPTIGNLENILFLRPEDTPEVKNTKIELVLEWKYITEKRKNFLIYLKRKLSFSGSIMSVDVSLGELNEAHRVIMDIVHNASDLLFPKFHSSTDDEFDQYYARELLQKLLEFSTRVNDTNQAIAIVSDMKLLTAIALNKKNEESEYRCSISAYVDYLKQLGIKNSFRECRECHIDTQFDEYSFCLCCGKRKP